MRLLVVGLGSIGRRHARNWVALGLGDVLVCRTQGSPQPEPLGIPYQTLHGLDQALSAKPDVVIVSNPTSLHRITAQAAIEAGCHVLVEKPLAASPVGVGDLLSLAERRRFRLAVGYQLRFHPGLQRLRALLESGAIGRPLAARAEYAEYLPDWHLWEDYRQSYSARAELGGGAILTLSHAIDALCWLLGPPSVVSAMKRRTGALEVDTDDLADITMQFASGILGTVHVDYVRRRPQRGVEIVAEEGVARWEYDDNRLLVYAAGATDWQIEEEAPTFNRNDMYLAELRQVIKWIEAGEPGALATGPQGAAVVAIAAAASQASAEGRHVRISSADGEDLAEWMASFEPAAT